MKSDRSKSNRKKNQIKVIKFLKLISKLKTRKPVCDSTNTLPMPEFAHVREADIFIAAGSVMVNGKPVTEMGYKVKLDDDVKFDGRSINPEPKEYYLLNKPQGFHTSGKIEHQNKTALNLLQKVTNAKLEPIGRLENSACGLILYTNDGTLAKKLGNAKKGNQTDL